MKFSTEKVVAALYQLTSWLTGGGRSLRWMPPSLMKSRTRRCHAQEVLRPRLRIPTETTIAGLATHRRTCAYVFIANLPHLADAYGQDFASVVSSELQRRLSVHALAVDATGIARLRTDCFLLWVDGACVCGASNTSRLPHESHLTSFVIERLLADLSAKPVRAGGVAAMMQLHSDLIDVRSPEQLSTSEMDFVLWTAQPFPHSHESNAVGWAEHYRADMEVAVRVSEALLAEDLSFSWQSVVHAARNASTFYREGRVRIAPNCCERMLLTQEVFMPCLRRLGLARAFDRVAVLQALSALRLQTSARFGISIFAQSVKIDHWWASILSALDDEPTLASRLVIEIRDYETLSDLEAAQYFCMQMQSRGCRIALCNVGGGSDNLTAVQLCKPDIVKLHASFMRCARNSAFGRECLRATISLCARLAFQVVVDGVERKDDVEIALGAGAQFLQGYGVRAATHYASEQALSG